MATRVRSLAVNLQQRKVCVRGLRPLTHSALPCLLPKTSSSFIWEAVLERPQSFLGLLRDLSLEVVQGFMPLRCLCFLEEVGSTECS
jgi:hypothetical protein